MSTTTNSFDFKGLNVRVVMMDGDPWFLVGDVCRALGAFVYGGKVNVTMATAGLSRGETRFSLIELTPGYPRQQTLVSESGLYRMILRAHPSRPEVAAVASGPPPPMPRMSTANF